MSQCDPKALRVLARIATQNLETVADVGLWTFGLITAAGTTADCRVFSSCGWNVGSCRSS